jgi:hypothetical protein
MAEEEGSWPIEISTGVLGFEDGGGGANLVKPDMFWFCRTRENCHQKVQLWVIFRMTARETPLSRLLRSP